MAMSRRTTIIVVVIVAVVVVAAIAAAISIGVVSSSSSKNRSGSMTLGQSDGVPWGQLVPSDASLYKCSASGCIPGGTMTLAACQAQGGIAGGPCASSYGCLGGVCAYGAGTQTLAECTMAAACGTYGCVAGQCIEGAGSLNLADCTTACDSLPAGENPNPLGLTSIGVTVTPAGGPLMMYMSQNETDISQAPSGPPMPSPETWTLKFASTPITLSSFAPNTSILLYDAENRYLGSYTQAGGLVSGGSADYTISLGGTALAPIVTLAPLSQYTSASN